MNVGAPSFSQRERMGEDDACPHIPDSHPPFGKDGAPTDLSLPSCPFVTDNQISPRYSRCVGNSQPMSLRAAGVPRRGNRENNAVSRKGFQRYFDANPLFLNILPITVLFLIFCKKKMRKILKTNTGPRSGGDLLVMVRDRPELRYPEAPA